MKNLNHTKNEFRPLALVLCAAVFLAACDREKISIYNVPKADPEQMASTAKIESGSDSEAKWTAPQDWKQQPATPPRLATFLVEGEGGQRADVSVTAFPGGTGSDLDNVNRWRGQLTLPPIAEADLAVTLKKIDAGGQTFLVAEMEKDGKAIRGAILRREDRTWFFKMTGDAPLVAVQKEAFSEFLKSVRVGGTPAATAVPQPPAAPVANDRPGWKTPAGWQEQPAGGMRAGSFSIAEDDRKADVSIIVLGGAAGGTLANINRWRQQLALAPISEDELAAQSQKAEAAGGSATVVDIVGEAPTIDGKYKARILGAIIERGGQIWFVKMNGEDALVEKQKPAFLEFLKTMQLP